MSKLFNRSSNNYNFIDGIRAIAVLWVIFFHAWLFHYFSLPGTIDKIYDVIKHSYQYLSYSEVVYKYKLKNDDSRYIEMYTYHFVELENYRANQIEKILE